MEQILLTPEEIEAAHLLGGQQYMVAVQYSVNIPSLDTCCKRALAKAQLKKVATEFDKFGIYEIKDDRFFWNPQKLREFMEILRKEAGAA